MAMSDRGNCEDTNTKVEKLIEELGPKRYSHVDLEKFTSNFSEANILGSGAHGVVYKGQLPNGVQVAVKRLEHKDVVEETFMAEVSTISATNHRNLIKLKGCCFEPNMRALVYEYMENGSLDKILYECGSSIEWEKFYGIAIEIAKGLDYLHDGFDGQIIHYDIKAGNVLLDKNLSAKITDFGMAKLLEMNVSHVPLTRTKGTPGYNAPETWMPESQVTYKCDVYSFGMLLFELLGKRNNGVGENWFPGLVWEKFQKGELEHELNYIGIIEVNIENAKLLSMVALWCVQFKPENRPTMREVVSMLEKTIQVKRPPNPFPFWKFSESSMLPSPERISEEYLESFYGIDGRPIQDAESFLFSLEGNIFGSTNIVSAECESQVTFQPSTVEEGVAANATLSAFSVDVANPDGGLDIFASVQKILGKINYSNGDSYEGTWENGLRHGLGRFVWANGDVYIGEWKNDVREGHGKITYKCGNCCEGTFRNSKKDGQGRFVWVDGDEYSGEWKNNVREEHGKFTCKDEACYEGAFRNSKIDGHGRYDWANGNTYNGEWKNDVQEGQGRFVWANGNSYNGEWKNNVREGQGKFVWANGDACIGEWKKNVLEGNGKLTYSNGNCYEGTFKNSKKDGQGRFVWDNGDVYIGEWKNNDREGHGKFIFKDGTCYEGTFKNSKRDGHGRHIWAGGHTYNGEWKNDVQEGNGRFVWANGNSYNGEWKNNVREGQGKFVWTNGDASIGEWKNNVREGLGKITYKNGNSYEGTFRNSKKDGQGRFVWDNGDVYIGEWKDNDREGHGKFIFKNGAYYEGTFRNSKRDGPGRYVWAGGDTYIGEWKNDKLKGQGKFVWANGNSYNGEWKNNNREGQGRYVWANGDEYSGEWKNGGREGHGKYTYKDGDIWEGTYENNRPVKGRFTYRKSRLLRFVDRLI